MLQRRAIFYGWVVVLAIAFVSFGSTGARFSFAAFYKPMTEEFGWSRAALAMAPTLNLLLSAVLRLAGGWLVDRYGAKKFAILGIVVSGIVTGLLSFVTELWQAYALFMLLALGYVAGPTTTVKIVGSWFTRRRALALSLASTGIALGELVILPLAAWMVVVSSWQTSYRVLSLMLFALMLPVGLIFIKNTPAEKGTLPDGNAPAGVGSAVRVATRESAKDASLLQALRSATFWKLGLGFFVCGFTMAFANTHFIAFATDHGFEQMVATFALALVGGFSIPGSLLLGYLSDHVPRHYVLGAVYFLRGLSFLVLLGAHDNLTLYLASFIIGVSWTATLPLTAAISTDLWGLASIGTITGAMQTIMPLGSALGLMLDAWIYDITGDYQLALWLNVAAGFAAALAVFFIREKRLAAEKVPVVA